MKKILTGFLILTLCTMQAMGQKGFFSIGAGAVFGVPVSNSNFSYYYKKAIGPTVVANYGVTKLGSITTTVSYFFIGAKNQPVTNTSLTMIKAGYRTNFLNSGFFVSGDAGLAKYGSGGSSNFATGTAAGYSFKISKASYIDLFPAYNLILGTPNNKMWLTANVLFRFNLKKTK